VSLGTGDLTIDANLVRGNFAEGGHGGGIRLQQVNGAEIQATLNNGGNAVPARWHQVTVTNNMIVDNVAGYAGGGIALADTVRAFIDNNTVASNDSTGIAGAVLAAAVAPQTSGVGRPSPSGIVSEPTSQALINQFTSNGQRTTNAISQPVELVNNIFWQNRSFFYDGAGHLCVGNSLADVTPTCTATAKISPTDTRPALPAQTFSGQCVTGTKYWDLGVLGDTSPTPGSTHLTPSYSVVTAGYTTGYTGNTNTNPLLVNQYCNGSRVVPELGGVINPPSVLNLAVAATVDEGNNYVNLRYGPLYVENPVNSTTFGDYHLSGTSSSAYNTGTSGGAVPNHDYDNQSRPQAGAYDIGADEFVAVAAVADLSITKTDGRTTVAQGTTGVTYTVVVTNGGPAAVTGATLTDTLPGGTRFTVSTWSCSATAGSSCTATGTGNTTRTGSVSLLNGGSATYTLVGNVPSTAPTGASTNTATIAAPAGVTDPNLLNNIAFDTDTVQ
jgi:uncharacterized repeat protein (TIGR01451 family)